jgi:large subunit ribosomal protein L10
MGAPRLPRRLKARRFTEIFPYGLWERRNHLITKAKKTTQLGELKQRFEKSKGIVLTEYKGMTVAQMAELRKQLKEVGGEYKVCKNTLVSLAAKDTPFELAKSYLIGPTGVAFGYEDPIAVAKKVLEFSIKNDKFAIKSGIIDGTLFDAAQIKEVAKLPARPVLLGMLAGVMQAPAQKFAAALNATVAQLGYALEAVKNKKTA